MAQSVKDIMTTDVVTVEAKSTVREAAQQMKAHGVGDVLVIRDGSACGIVTDRDISIRAVADGKDPAKTTVGDIRSAELVALSPRDSVEDATRIVREQAVRRSPFSTAVGRSASCRSATSPWSADPTSALAEVSAAAPSS